MFLKPKKKFYTAGIAPYYKAVGGGGGTAVAIDGHTLVHTTTTTGVGSLTTANAGDVIVVMGWANANTGAFGNVSISDNFNGGAGLTWTSRVDHFDSTNQAYFYIYWAVAASAITSGSVTVNYSGVSGYGNYANYSVFGVSGAHTAAPFDTQGGSVYSPVASGLASITTVTANDFIFGCSYDTGTPGALGGGWSKMDDNVSASFFLSEYQVAAGAGTFTINIGSATLFAGSIIDAIVPGP